MTKPHVAVVGLGIMGSAALWHLARRGVRATGVEQFEPGHDRGSSHGASRIIRIAHFENAAYVPLMQRAYGLWRELEHLAGEKLLDLTGILEIGAEDGALVTGTLAAARRYDLAHEVLDADAVMRRWPAYRLPGSMVAMLQPDGGVIAADRAYAALLRSAKQAGAIVRAGEQVRAIEPLRDGVRVKTERDAIDADAAVVTAGPWLGALMPDLRLPLTVTRQVVGWFEPDDRARFAAARFPVFILESRHGEHYGFPVHGPRGLKIAKHHHHNQAVDPDRYDRTATAADEAAIRAPLAEHLPGANGPLLAAETCLYTMTPDGTFIIDRLPAAPQIAVASPCCGHGFKFAPVVGEILADLATRGSTRHDIAAFRLQRFF